jgi:cobyrinic acid a,c-diamide synthase
VRITGVILNNVASARHAGLIVPALERAGLTMLGVLMRNDRLSLPERHLGLVQVGETDDVEKRLDAIADAVETGVEIEALLNVAMPCAEFTGAARGLAPPGQRIALAQDCAFSFIYPHIVAGWRAAGAEIAFFSPLADEAPNTSADAVWLPGGYPELHAGRLAANGRFRGGLADLAAHGVPIHGECGGYMVLGAGLEDAQGGRHAMAGLLGVETSFKQRKLHLGYRRVRLLVDSALGSEGTVLFGHEFHYASLVAASDDPLVATEDGGTNNSPIGGSRRGSVTGTFFHVIDRAA